ncbi:hypothetical protein [Spiroplasma poulsonii]|uniref:hypothetical protein n=1 Tax=Spiroplasma poulsonii TaxID=2138 RepID=UPI0010572C2F|nr:hypothetical protein [Spiroplasma poulsonii]
MALVGWIIHDWLPLLLVRAKEIRIWFISISFSSWITSKIVSELSLGSSPKSVFVITFNRLLAIPFFIKILL